MLRAFLASCSRPLPLRLLPLPLPPAPTVVVVGVVPKLSKRIMAKLAPSGPSHTVSHTQRNLMRKLGLVPKKGLLALEFGNSLVDSVKEKVKSVNGKLIQNRPSSKKNHEDHDMVASFLPYNLPTAVLQTSFIKSDNPNSSHPTPQTIPRFPSATHPLSLCPSDNHSQNLHPHPNHP